MATAKLVYIDTTVNDGRRFAVDVDGEIIESVVLTDNAYIVGMFYGMDILRETLHAELNLLRDLDVSIDRLMVLVNRVFGAKQNASD